MVDANMELRRLRSLYIRSVMNSFEVAASMGHSCPSIRMPGLSLDEVYVIRNELAHSGLVCRIFSECGNPLKCMPNKKCLCKPEERGFLLRLRLFQDPKTIVDTSVQENEPMNSKATPILIEDEKTQEQNEETEPPTKKPCQIKLVVGT